MKTITFYSLTFSTYFRLSCLINFAFGCFTGLFLFAVSLLGGNVTTKMFFVQLHGIAGGFAAVFFAPLFFAGLGAVAALVSYYPFNWLLQQWGGIQLSGRAVENTPS